MDPELLVINDACALMGGQAEMARLLAITPGAVNQWCRGLRKVSADRCPDIERLTGGRFHCERLRSDQRWRRIRDPEWPWHPDGKPLLDVATPTPTDAPISGFGALSEQEG